MATVGVLCARTRVEEKALMAALAEAGIVSALFPPADEPLPVGPLPIAPTERVFPVPQLVVDRHPNRQIARAVLSTCRALDVPTLCAGIAASGDRLDVASVLTARGLPRPPTMLCTSEAAALHAVAAMGIPATLLPLELQDRPIALLDSDAAEAVLEHRAVLGGREGSIGLIQVGSPGVGSVATAIVVDGVATAIEAPPGVPVGGNALRLAEEAASALHAELIAVVVTLGEAPVVWDTRPVPDFRHALPIGGLDVAAAIAQAVARRLETPIAATLPGERTPAWVELSSAEMRGHVVISA